ncbi:MAG: DUF2188 domain-containing protein [Marinifilaceae bacterium]|nr:DUF2188 domain-containing protein [Marinifilaceae bacterium]
MSKLNTKRKLTESFKKAASTKNSRIHVVPSNSGWSVKKEGSKRASSVSPTKSAAISLAKTMKSGDRIIVHKKDGTIQENTKK